MSIRAIFLGCALLASLPSCGSQASPEPAGAPSMADAKVVVTFFTEAEECETTAKVRKLCQGAIETGFGEELKSGEVYYRVLCNTLPENDHFIDDYDIGEKALIVSRQENGKEAEWLRCDDLWLYIEEPDALTTCVQKPIRDYLAKK